MPTREGSSGRANCRLQGVFEGGLASFDRSSGGSWRNIIARLFLFYWGTLENLEMRRMYENGLLDCGATPVAGNVEKEFKS